MKIKSLLVSLLALCVIALSSCSEEENYAENYVGTYSMTVVPSITATITIAGIEIEQEFPADTIKDVTCTIKETLDNSVTVSTNVMNMPLVMVGTCDETGMHLKSYTINLDQLDLDMDIPINSLTLGSTTVNEPVNGKISWTSSISGEITNEMGTLPIKGNLAFSGTKQ